MSGDQDKKQRPAGRKLAEWVTLGVSVVLVLGVAGHLLREALEDRPPYIPVTVRVLTEEAGDTGGTFVLPLEVANRGGRTITSLTVRVTTRPADGGAAEPTEIDLTIDYLGEGASERVYVVLDRHPRELRVEARTVSYQLE